MRTVWIFGDQLHRRLGALADSTPDDTRVLLVESEALPGPGRHVQRLHLVITAMRRFARELADEGFDVDLRRASSLSSGLRAHVDEHAPDEVVATEPNSRGARVLCDRHRVRQLHSDQFLCHPDEFATWAKGRPTLRMEAFYRWQRTRLGYLMDGDEPAEGRWSAPTTPAGGPARRPVRSPRSTGTFSPGTKSTSRAISAWRGRSRACADSGTCPR